MRSWNIPAKPPLILPLAADTRLTPVSYTNDQIWELTLGTGEPPALALQTTFGLRALGFRLFWRFSEGGLTLSDPAAFAAPPVLQAFYPNYLRLNFDPLAEISISAEYWAASSQIIAGRMQVENHSAQARQISFELAANLIPIENGRRMAAVEMGAATVLSGQTGDLYPLVFLTGGAQAGVGAYPSLCLRVEIASRQVYRLTWVEVAEASAEESFELARATAARNWNAEVARIELTNAGQIDIHTGDADWDFALAAGQNAAWGLLMNASNSISAASPALSFVTSRQPDQGYSPRGDGSDYALPWSGQTPLDTCLLFDQILPAGAAVAKSILRNFLATQMENGFIDGRPGLAGQRSQIWATPLLATLAERIYQADGDQAFLGEVFSPLLAFVHAWLSAHDRDGDGAPEWDHPVQTGFDEHPIFSRWHPWAQGVNITTAECPDLCAYLYCECQALQRIALIVQHKEAIPALEAFTDILRTVIDANWDEKAACYRYWDRDSHLTTRRETLGERYGPGEILIQRDFAAPVRLMIGVEAQSETARGIVLFITGAGVSGQHRVERLGAEQFNWFMQNGLTTGERVYAHLERIEVQGIDDADRVRVQTAGYEVLDHTLLLPLWAGIPSSTRAQALMQRTLMSEEAFASPYGLRACPNPPESYEDSLSLHSVHLLWNAFVMDGMLDYGFRKEAATLFGRLMGSMVQALKRDGSFRRHYRADNGQGLGERNSLGGLPPAGLFLRVLGVKIASPRQVSLQGFNPFAWPVTVKYRGLTILRQSDKTTVIFPDGQTVVIDDPRPCTVMLQ